MRFYTFAAAAALLTASLAAHADTMTIPQTFSVSGSMATRDNTDLYSVNTTPLTQFNPSLGTLNGISFTLSGSATSTSGSDFFAGINDRNEDLVDGQGAGSGTFNFSANGQDTYSPDFGDFEGTGTLALQLEFFGPTTVNSALGTITYDYTPAVSPVAATPEPASLVLLGTGLLGALGVARKHLA